MVLIYIWRQHNETHQTLKKKRENGNKMEGWTSSR
jgi:hypothetical protein